jgi:RNAse (barnase) inhibitor barstar
MRIIELDATKWKTYDDFYNALLPSIGAPKWHGQNLNALVDSMVWGGINAVEPPYKIRISGATTLPKNIRDHIETAKRALTEGRLDYQRLRGGDVDVSMEIEP